MGLEYRCNNQQATMCLHSWLWHSIPLLSDDLLFNAHLPRLFGLTTNVSKNGVHLFQCSPHGLRNKEECEHERKQAEDREECVRSVSSVLHERRRNETLHSCQFYSHVHRFTLNLR